MQDLDIEKIKVGADWPNLQYTPLWWAVVKLYGNRAPKEVSNVAIHLAGITACPIEYFEHVANEAHSAVTPQEMKTITLRELRSLLQC